ncbi:putative non-LTR retroelement reverse transcriptase related protein, partial [Trifolium medium]|nr:putative non-LTR retroelement reverse transcriptase related protein [Trifolium medium]
GMVVWGAYFENGGDESDTFFWIDHWVDETPLCERFGRLFDLAENKSASVAEMFSLGWGAEGEAWVWRPQLRAWEEEMLGGVSDFTS